MIEIWTLEAPRWVRRACVDEGSISRCLLRKLPRRTGHTQQSFGNVAPLNILGRERPRQIKREPASFPDPPPDTVAWTVEHPHQWHDYNVSTGVHEHTRLPDVEWRIGRASRGLDFFPKDAIAHCIPLCPHECFRWECAPIMKVGWRAPKIGLTLMSSVIVVPAIMQETPACLRSTKESSRIIASLPLVMNGFSLIWEGEPTWSTWEPTQTEEWTTF